MPSKNIVFGLSPSAYFKLVPFISPNMFETRFSVSDIPA